MRGIDQNSIAREHELARLMRAVEALDLAVERHDGSPETWAVISRKVDVLARRIADFKAAKGGES